MNILTKNKIINSFENFHFYTGLKTDDLASEDKEALLTNMKLIKLPKKGVLYGEGEIPRGIYIITSGKIKFTQLNLDGSQHILSVYTINDIIGYRPILCDELHFVSAVALEPCKIFFIEREQFKKIVYHSIHLSNLLLTSMSHEYVVMANRINIFAKKSLKERLAYFLLLLNEKYKSGNPLIDEDDLTEIRLNRIDLASYIGTSIEPLVRTIKEFRDLDYIRGGSKSIFINNFEALIAISGI